MTVCSSDAVIIGGGLAGASSAYALARRGLKVLLCEVAEGSGAPGTFISDDLTAACGSGAIRLLKLQREGKGAMDAGEFLRGFPVPRGTVAR